MTGELINPKKAAECATAFYRETTGNYSPMTLEEIELRGDFWYVTLGIPRGGLVYDQKDYKVFKVNAKTGIVEAMTLRK
jgi:hypothetical protein